MSEQDKYQKEKFTAKVLALFEAQVEVAALYAELCEQYPEAAAMLGKRDPSLQALRDEAERKWNERNGTQV